MAKDPKDRPAKPTAKEKLAEQRKMKEDLSGALLSGRLAASTETVTKVRVPTDEIDKRAPKQNRGAIPPPRRPKPPQQQPPTGLENKKGPIKKKQPEPPRKKKPVKTKDGKKVKRVAWDPKRLSQFVAGFITLGELEGISKDEQYEMAKLGHRLLREGRLPDAKKVFEGLVTLDPRDAYFHLALGAIAQKSDDLTEAEKRYTAALEINPYSPHALANRGEVRMMLGKMVDGAKDLMRALEEDPNAEQEATKRARATIGVVLQQLEEAGVDVGKKKAPERAAAAKPGPRKKVGVRGPPKKVKPRRPAPKKR